MQPSSSSTTTATTASEAASNTASRNESAPRDEQTVRKEAVAWYALLCSGAATEADHQALQHWLEQHPDHLRAWERIGTIQSTLQRVPANIALPTLQVNGLRRRALLRSMVLFATTGSVAWLSYQATSNPSLLKPLLADYRTRVGERRSVTLPDGSRMLLNTDSLADVSFSDTTRTITLWAGEILIETASHRQKTEDLRPFLVQTAQGTIRALGTRFMVRKYDDHTQVSVLEQAVELYALNGSRPQMLQAGETTRFTSSGVSPLQPLSDTAAQWEHGSLVVGNERLGDLIAELSRYRRGRLVCDPAVEDIRVSGAYPIDDTDQALRVLKQSFPLRISRITRYWVVVGPA